MSNLYKSLIDVQSKLNVPKSQYNTFAEFSYRSCEDIMEAVKPLLASAGLIQFVSDEIVLIGERYYVKATVTVTDGTDSHSVFALAREALSKPKMDDAQVTGSTSSYARKYALNGMYNIDDSKDPDTNEYRDLATKKASNSVAGLSEADLDKKIEGITKSKERTLEQLLEWIGKSFSISDNLKTLGDVSYEVKLKALNKLEAKK